ncbi:MAG: HAD-IIB family hydrolase [Methylicorpusculum sp.]|uniref:HAD-IIB family hydrolase n=1 Tax=Methylicorpusculum sp. TaxID=2713644 RepID=UPI0027229297|nr:HAD-IIB family hydrolase [Methylicorpusculum sp.]MDO8844265.1 HAD-IIB family hydrolase [Methylicorpusculum sp.]MDO8939406.1 HAD-IIB family hydrolase [Methylicorpusculum sp.]MDP2180319.1 HAD-IIB family hydrolase [Methylicorpusculum sp.]MDP2203962.1 HAD-IIB family hydrolase [Methylicorpusculum sp.]MDP3531469.1 HAD-IIB family hydrolase [Methylicorpusculum sp.]
MISKLLLCTDLDRTLLPNGNAPESPAARPLFAVLAGHPNCTLVYVTGRHKALVQQAVTEFDLPVPDFVIGDVGTTIYQIADNEWHEWSEWVKEIAPDWAGREHADMHHLFSHLPELSLQESAKQNRFKLSYYVQPAVVLEPLLIEMRKQLAVHSIRAELIFSIDEAAHVGLLDVLPAGATKFHAVDFLMKQLGFGLENSVFAGDSGNDLPVLTSPIRSVLVANASDEVREQAQLQAREQSTGSALYLAKGGFMGMNGNYSAGILEGCVHYLPEIRRWIADYES